MKLESIVVFLLLLPPLCFGVSGRVTISFSQNSQTLQDEVQGEVITNVSTDSFSLKTDFGVSTISLFLNKQGLADMQNSLKNSFGNSFSEEVYDSAFKYSLVKNQYYKAMEILGEIDHNDPTNQAVLKINYAGIIRMFEVFLIKSNCQITRVAEKENHLGRSLTEIYFKEN